MPHSKKEVKITGTVDLMGMLKTMAKNSEAKKNKPPASKSKKVKGNKGIKKDTS